MSEQEVTNSAYGFNSDCNDDSARQLKSSDYAKSQGIAVGTIYAGNTCWWLRAPSYEYDGCALLVNASGYPNGAISVYETSLGVVPALWIHL